MERNLSIAIISFSQRGARLAGSLAGALQTSGHCVEAGCKGRFISDVFGGSAPEAGARAALLLPPAERTFSEGISIQPVSETLSRWTERAFREKEALIFVGAAGIAVRAIAPYIKRKDQDPAVIAVDETGQFIIPLLSGHIGGANALAQRIAEQIGGTPVITTATDRNQKFAVDEWAARQGLSIVDLSAAKDISAAILAGIPVGLAGEIEIVGAVPQGIGPGPAILEAGGSKKSGCVQAEKGCRLGGGEAGLAAGRGTARRTAKGPAKGAARDGEGETTENQAPQTDEEEGHQWGQTPGLGIYLSDGTLPVPRVWEEQLTLVAPTLILGIGCRRGTKKEKIQAWVEAVLRENHLSVKAVAAAATIDLKKEEKGLLEFCEDWKIPLIPFSAEELQEVEGAFTPSAFVQSVTGVDNVCERAALRATRMETAVREPREDAAAADHDGPLQRPAENLGQRALPGGALLIRKTAKDGVTVAVARTHYRARFE